DEGYVKGPSASQDDDGDLYLHEAVFGWDGWSLVAALPGPTITTGDRVERVTTPPPPESPLTVDVRVKPGSLPRLRFGHTYRFRARLVDLAGNSVPDRAVVE